MTTIDKVKQACDRVNVNAALLRVQLERLVPFFNALNTRYCYYYPADATIIVGVHTRDDLTKIRALKSGPWKKRDVTSDQDDTLAYENTVDGIVIDVRVNSLPPSCRVVEERIEVPASVRIVRRVVCNEPSQEDAESGKILSTYEVPA